MRTHQLPVRVLICLFIVLTCSFAQANGLAPFSQSDVPPAPDFAQSASWLAQPDNPSEHPVDIFWVYPTILADDTHWLMDVTSPSMIKKAQGTIRKQASVFMDQANLYAPLYRQMNMAAIALSPAEQQAIIKYGMEDVWHAFSYYLKHLNQGRPFILAGHSQGSNLLTELVIRYWGTLGVEEQLVAGYFIGWSITGDDLKKNPTLAICESAKQTNCFINYNTMANGRQSFAPTRIAGALVVNPLTWTTSGDFAPASLNLGSKFFYEDGTSEVIPNFTSAQIIDSGLVVQPKDPALVDSGSATFPKGVYHVFDYSLFYENLRQNVGVRIKNFFSQTQ